MSSAAISTEAGQLYHAPNNEFRATKTDNSDKVKHRLTLIEIQAQAAARVVLHGFLKASASLIYDIPWGKCIIHKVGYPEELDMSRLDMGASTVLLYL